MLNRNNTISDQYELIYMDKVFVILILVFYCPAALWLFLYGMNNYYMIYLFLRKNKKEVSQNAEFLKSFWSTRKKDELPKVTTQLPIYNERHVVERLIEAVVLCLPCYPFHS